MSSATEESHWRIPGANIPMTKWTSGLVQGLRETATVHVAGHCYEASWPKGRLFPSQRPGLDRSIVTHPVGFSNLPWVRTQELTYQYRHAAKRYLAKNPKSQILLTYNPYRWHVAAGMQWKKLGRTWINIVLDYDEKDLGKNWSTFNRLCGQADGQVFLSWWGFQNYPGSNKLHLDAGGLPPFAECKPKTGDGGKQIILYAGKIGEHGGASLMARTFLATPGEHLEFWVCGRGQSNALTHACSIDKRIKCFGYVGDAELHELCLRASVFFNPRDPAYSENRMVFPSKIFHYLRYGKPIVSTFTEGLAPVYKPYLFIDNDPSPESLAVQIHNALNQTPEQLDLLRRNIFSFITTDRSWKKQADRLLDFMDSHLDYGATRS